MPVARGHTRVALLNFGQNNVGTHGGSQATVGVVVVPSSSSPQSPSCSRFSRAPCILKVMANLKLPTSHLRIVFNTQKPVLCWDNVLSEKPRGPSHLEPTIYPLPAHCTPTLPSHPVPFSLQASSPSTCSGSGGSYTAPRCCRSSSAPPSSASPCCPGSPSCQR